MLQTIKFHYKIKKPTLLDNNVFVLYSPQRLKFEPGEKTTISLIKYWINATKLQLLKRKYKLTV